MKGWRWLNAMNGSTALILDMLAVDVDPSEKPSLVRRARVGDAAAFGELVAEHEQTVLRTAWRLVRNIEDARDVAQEAFLRLHRHLSTLDPDRDPAPWLYRVTVNLGLSALRRRRRRPEAVLDGAREVAEISAGRPEQERLGEAADARRVLASALDRLSDKERAAVVLRQGATPTQPILAERSMPTSVPAPTVAPIPSANTEVIVEPPQVMPPPAPVEPVEHGPLHLARNDQSTRGPETAISLSAPTEPMTVKILTDDPDVVIYWIVDPKGDKENA